MGKLTYFPLVLDRWISGTRFLSLEEKGAYLELLCYLYEDRERYIKDDAHVARILGVRKARATRIFRALNGKFTRIKQGYYHGFVRELHKNGMKLRGLQGEASPINTRSQILEEEKEKPPFGGQKEREEVQPKSTAHGTRLPNDWKPSAEDLDWARAERPSVSLNRETEKFRNYWLATPGQKGRKVRWDLTWRNWITKAAEDMHKHRGNGKAGDVDLESLAAQLGMQAKPGESKEAWHMRIRAAATRAH